MEIPTEDTSIPAMNSPAVDVSPAVPENPEKVSESAPITDTAPDTVPAVPPEPPPDVGAEAGGGAPDLGAPVPAPLPEMQKTEEGADNIANDSVDSAKSPNIEEKVPVAEVSPFEPYIKRARELLVMAREAIQRKKRQRIERIMGMFDKKKQIKTIDAAMLLHISDRTVRHYFSILEKEGRLRKVGTEGRGVWYEKM